MNQYQKQLDRIKHKLAEAAKIDTDFKVFGASGHRYQLHEPAQADQVLAFEHQYDIQLPDCYKSFICEIGNGGIGYQNSGAGPFYGIYPLGQGVDDLIYLNTEKHLKNEFSIDPILSQEDWEMLFEKYDDEDLSDDEYEKIMGQTYGGILPIGFQGCTSLHGIVLNGKYKGKVLNLDRDNQKPRFTFEANFLDWYERWLDEVISEELISDSATWFGYTMGGSENYLLDVFNSNPNVEIKKQALSGLLIKKEISTTTLESIYLSSLKKEEEFTHPLLEILVKFNHPKWKEQISELAKTDFLQALQHIYWYDKSEHPDWRFLIEQNVKNLNDPKVFHLSVLILERCHFDHGQIIAKFSSNELEEIRLATIKSLGKLENKQDYLDTFISGLHDQSKAVIRTSIQALSGVNDSKLLPHYQKVALTFLVEDDYILSNLEYRLRDFNLDLNKIRELEF